MFLALRGRKAQMHVSVSFPFYFHRRFPVWQKGAGQIVTVRFGDGLQVGNTLSPAMMVSRVEKDRK